MVHDSQLMMTMMISSLQWILCQTLTAGTTMAIKMNKLPSSTRTARVPMEMSLMEMSTMKPNRVLHSYHQPSLFHHLLQLSLQMVVSILETFHTCDQLHRAQQLLQVNQAAIFHHIHQ